MWMENDFCANNSRAVSTQSRIDVHARHTSLRAFLPHASEAQVFLEELWDWHASLPMSGEEKSPVCLQPLPSNHIITALKADIWQKPRKWARWRRSSFCCSYYLITLFSCEMLGVCLCKAIIYLAGMCHHNYPPEIHKWRAVAETEAIQTEGNRAALISFKYL